MTNLLLGAGTVPKIIGNPLYVWTHLELKRFFGVDLMINEENAPEIWQIVNQKLQSKTFSKENHRQQQCATHLYYR